jgi:phospholipase C
VDGNGASPGFGRDRIRHVIVLMMENRSFDHLLGYLQHEDARYPNLDRLGVSCPVDPEHPDTDLVPTSPDASHVLGVDPDHSHESVMLQLFGKAGEPDGDQPTMNGFIRSFALKIGGNSPRPVNRLSRILQWVIDKVTAVWKWLTGKPAPVVPDARNIMRCFAEPEVPVLSRLAKEFAVFVNWHASVPGETWPNRNYAHAATSHGTTNIAIKFYGDETVFEQLAGQEKNKETSWGIYHDGIAQVWAFWRLWTRWLGRFHGMDRLFKDIENGTLPSYAFVEPNHGFGLGEGNSQHPANNASDDASFIGGELLMGRIYNALVSNPMVFAKTLFLITYDEHGGFFDHVPPRAVVPPDGMVSPSRFDFRLSGVRVPAVAISPLIPKGTIVETFYDHASIPKTVRSQFAVGAGPLNPRDEAANDVLDDLSLLPAERTDCTPVDVPERPAVAEAAISRTLNEFEASLLELAGAVKTQLEQVGVAETDVEPPFRPDPALSAAAKARVMVPGSPASQAADDVIARFVAPSPNDSTGIELGP